MRESARFAVSFLSALALAASAFAADVRDASEPARVASVFPKTAELRVLNLWATWCAPCVEEMPDLRAIDAAFGSEVAFAGLSLDALVPGTKREKVIAFLDREKIAFPNIFYTGNPDALGAELKITGEIPVTLVYDASGRELWRHEGRIDREELIAELRRLLLER